MQPLISVIIPLYNGASYVEEALSSVLAQTYPSIEVIVVDDGSTDGSAAVVRRFGSALRYLAGPNEGSGAARNRGLHLARGEYFAFLDQDDVWAPDKLRWQMAAFEADPSLDMVFGQVQQFYSPDWEERDRKTLYCPPEPRTGYLPSAMLIEKGAFFQVGPFETQWHIGAWANWYVRAVETGLLAHVVPRVVARRRLHAGNHGLVARAHVREYVHILKASLDRRRLLASSSGDAHSSPIAP